MQEQIKAIEDKRTDAGISRKKAAAWASVQKKYAAKYGETRNLKQLKEQWKQIKIVGYPHNQ